MIYGIIIVLVILICILFLPIKAELLYKEQAKLKVSFSGIPIYRKTLKKGEKQKDKLPREKAQKLEKNSQKLGEKIDAFREFYKFTTKLLNRYVKLDEIMMKIELGTGDAPTTAISTGALWGVVYGLIAKIGSICEIKKHHVEINPNYNGAVFSFEGKCIIKSSIAYIIIIAITILIKIKSRKGKHSGLGPA